MPVGKCCIDTGAAVQVTVDSMILVRDDSYEMSIKRLTRMSSGSIRTCHGGIEKRERMILHEHHQTCIFLQARTLLRWLHSGQQWTHSYKEQDYIGACFQKQGKQGFERREKFDPVGSEAVVLRWLVLRVLVESARGSDGPIVSSVLLKIEATKLDVGSIVAIPNTQKVDPIKDNLQLARPKSYRNPVSK
ncbi:hypothetical protein Q9966_015429 [Columba livia]|nr:hypothetical protein Q9966_015429 [Columba livia]